MGRLRIVLGGNGKYSSKCSFVLTLFYGEKSSCEDKPFKGLLAPLQSPREDFTLKSVNAHRNPFAPPKAQKSSFALSLKLCCEIAARQAREYGVLYEVKLFSTKVLFFTYSNSQQDTPLRPARCREMTTYVWLVG